MERSRAITSKPSFLTIVRLEIVRLLVTLPAYLTHVWAKFLMNTPHVTTDQRLVIPTDEDLTTDFTDGL